MDEKVVAMLGALVPNAILAILVLVFARKIVTLARQRLPHWQESSFKTLGALIRVGAAFNLVMVCLLFYGFVNLGR